MGTQRVVEQGKTTRKGTVVTPPGGGGVCVCEKIGRQNKRGVGNRGVVLKGSDKRVNL